MIDILIFDGCPSIYVCPQCRISFPYWKDGVLERCHKCGSKIVEFMASPIDYKESINEKKDEKTNIISNRS